MDSNVEFIAADNPHANRLTVHILAAVAEHERGAISERTKAALAAAKRHGVKLGGPRLAAARKASIALLSPEIPKPIRGQLGVPNGVLDVFVPEPGL
jgi:DNA invertase Pin-like site-specific DNA recombinase